MQFFMRETYSKGRMPHLCERIDITDVVKNETSLHGGGPLQVDIDAEVLAGRIVVNGKVEGELELICSRCLSVFRDKMDFRFVELFTNKTRTEEGETAAEDETIVHYVTEDKVDLVPYIEEHIVLELPRFPLCGQHCKGLCPTCGSNRNSEVCSCNDQKMDPRWSGLQDLFQ